MSLRSDIVARIKAQLSDAQVHARLEGNHLGLVVVSGEFEGLNLLKKQQRLYAAVADWITSGEVHAVNMQAYTPDQWEQAGPLRPDAQFE